MELLIALKKMGGKIEIKNKKIRAGEIVADIIVESSELNGCELDKEMAKLMIDEFPNFINCSITSKFSKLF